MMTNNVCHIHGGPYNWVVPRENRNCTMEPDLLLIMCRVNERSCLRRLVPQCGAVGGSNTVVVSSLEQIAVGPAHYEVTVVTMTGGISVCKSEFEICDFCGFEEELVENGEESNWVRCWAHASIVVTDCRVSHVTFVIRSVKVFPIPARGEENLRSHPVAPMRRKPWEIAARTKAHYRDGFLCLIACVKSASVGVSSDHPESIRKSQRDGSVIAVLGGWRVVASPQQIVHRRTAPRHQLPHSVRFSEVIQRRDPVVAVVDCLVAGGGVGDRFTVVCSHGALEGVASDHAVDVGGGDAWLDDGVRSLDGERLAVDGKDATNA